MFRYEYGFDHTRHFTYIDLSIFNSILLFAVMNTRNKFYSVRTRSIYLPQYSFPCIYILHSYGTLYNNCLIFVPFYHLLSWLRVPGIILSGWVVFVLYCTRQPACITGPLHVQLIARAFLVLVADCLYTGSQFITSLFRNLSFIRVIMCVTFIFKSVYN